MEIWFRNPLRYINQLVECNARNIVMHRGYTFKNHVDLAEWIHRSIPAEWEWWRLLHVGDQGSAEYGPTSFGRGEHLKPLASYPTWKYGADSLELLIWMLENPAGEDPEPYKPPHGFDDCRPRLDQEHRVIVSGLPSQTSSAGKKMSHTLAVIQRDYPEAIIHLHGKYSFQTIFGMGFASADFDPFAVSRGGSDVHLVNGDVADRKKLTSDQEQWINMVGHSVVGLNSPKGRCLYHVDACLWAANHYEKSEPFRLKADKVEDVDYSASEFDWKPSVVKRLMRKRVKDALQGDMIVCDICSLADSCRAYRAGSICTLPNSSGSELSKAFGSNDVDLILDGMANIMKTQADRASDALVTEGENEGLNPEVTRLLDGLFVKGEKFIKLKDPKRFKAPSVAIQNNVGVPGALPAAVAPENMAVADAIAALEDAGWLRDRITKEIVENVIETSIVPAPPPEISAVAEAVLIEESP